ncbi:MAG: autotransporter domain-containing protein, partial [Mesorhizobium sp.]
INTASASFEPYANLAYVNFDADGFTEKGGAAALSSGDRSSDTAFTTLGLRASTVLTLGRIPLLPLLAVPPSPSRACRS